MQNVKNMTSGDLESEVVVTVIAVVDDCGVESVSMLHDGCVSSLRNHGSRFVCPGMHVLVQVSHHL